MLMRDTLYIKMKEFRIAWLRLCQAILNQLTVPGIRNLAIAWLVIGLLILIFI